MSDSKDELFFKISEILCNNTHKISAEECFSLHCDTNPVCKNYGKCRIYEKTLEQLEYVDYDLEQSTFLKACPGSGKTEVIGLKSAYEIKKWHKKITGIAVLTYTNKATDVISDRILQFVGSSGFSHPHYIDTIDSWMHRFILNPYAHVITHYTGNDEDRSIQIIEKTSNAAFLQNEKLIVPFRELRPPNIQANQFYFLDSECEEITFSSGDFLVDNPRNIMTINPILKRKLQRIKSNFWKMGFVIPEDVDIICYKILSENSHICNIISNRFKIIFIDECQDMSSLKIEIFRLLKQNGSVLHIVGDLHQSIFSYNNADFKKIYQFSNEENFVQIPLNENFRSVQSIVNTCCKLVRPIEQICGQEDIPGKSHCILFSYSKDELHEIPKKFTEYLRQNEYSIDKSAILVRNHRLKKLLMGYKPDKPVTAKLVPTALYLWSMNDFNFKLESFHYLGLFLSNKLFKDKKYNVRQFYCPTDIQYHQWRFFLAEMLNYCIHKSNLADLSKIWSDWRREFNVTFPKIYERIQYQFFWLVSEKITDNFQIRSPSGKKNTPVIDTLGEFKICNDKEIELSTIHSAKGKTFNSILLVSSPQSSGSRTNGSGYWKQWLDTSHDKGESARFAYVASSRPKFLLAWAIPEKDYKDNCNIIQISSYGFIPCGHLGIILKANNKCQKTLENWF